MTDTYVNAQLVTDSRASAGQTTSLRASRCPHCHRTEFPALAECPAYGSPADAIELGPAATLAGFTEVLHPPPGAQVEVPYTIAVAAFAENISIMGLLDHHVPSDELAIGQTLEVCVVRTGAGLTYGFRLA